MKKPPRTTAKRASRREIEERQRLSLEFQRPDKPRDNGQPVTAVQPLEQVA